MVFPPSVWGEGRPRRRAIWIMAAVAAVVLAAGAALLFMTERETGYFRLEETTYGDLDGWADDDPAPALAALARSCAILAALLPEKRLGGAPQLAATAGDFAGVCAELPDVAPEDARDFFETRFFPFRIRNGHEKSGLITGYFEPELTGSRVKSARFATPILARPPELVAVDLGDFRATLRGQRIAGRVENGRLVPYADRMAIEGGELAGRDLEILYLDDPVDAFFLHIQGSGRVRLEGGPDAGQVIRLSYAGQNGHPYTAIGKVLVERGELEREAVSMQSIHAWLAEHRDAAAEVMNTNASYVFFAELPVEDPVLGPPGAEGSLLTPGRSIAVDRTHFPLGLPVWLTTAEKPGMLSISRLTVAQDTGGAIRGPVRADLFLGTGDGAGDIAGRMQETGTLTVLLPEPLAERARAVEW